MIPGDALRERPRHLLLIDDDDDDVRLLTMALERTGAVAEPIRARDGREGLALLEAAIAADHAPDLMVLDLNMPIMDGWQVLERMRDDERLSQVPVVVLTSSSSAAHHQRARELGARASWTKPSRFSELLDLARILAELASHPD